MITAKKKRKTVKEDLKGTGLKIRVVENKVKLPGEVEIKGGGGSDMTCIWGERWRGGVFLVVPSH